MYPMRMAEERLPREIGGEETEEETEEEEEGATVEEEEEDEEEEDEEAAAADAAAIDETIDIGGRMSVATGVFAVALAVIVPLFATD